MQLVQAKAIKTGVEHWRKRKWNTAGTLFWQLNDCWPVSSWSAVDYYRRPKALYYWAKNFYKPVKLIIDDEDNRATVHLVNDTLEAMEVELKVAIVDGRGNILKDYSGDICLKPNSVSLLRKFSMLEYKKEGTVIYAKITDPRDGQIIDEDEHILVSWLDFEFDVPKVEVNVFDEGDRKLLHLKSDRFIQGVFLPLNEKVHELSDNFFSLIPNVEKKIEYSGDLVSSGIRLKFPLLSRRDFV
jgi:beta-mannosidase